MGQRAFTAALLYVSIAYCLTGFIYRFYLWLRTKPNPVKLGIYPKPEKGGKWLTILKNALFFPRMRELDYRMWAVVLLLHAGLVLLILGHVRFLPFWSSHSTVLAVLHITGALVTLFSLAYLTLRRYRQPFRAISEPRDYLTNHLLLLVLLSGIIWNYFGNIPDWALEQYLAGFFTLKPFLPAELTSGLSSWLFLGHIVSVELFLVFAPLSKTIHFAGGIATNRIRSE